VSAQALNLPAVKLLVLQQKVRHQMRHTEFQEKKHAKIIASLHLIEVSKKISLYLAMVRTANSKVRLGGDGELLQVTQEIQEFS
jgi:hypothetical protein